MPFETLPAFSGAATGPQGEAGIPPEEIQQALRQVGQVPNPEESPAAVAVLNREAESVMGQLGVNPIPAPLPNTGPPAPPDTAQPQYPQGPVQADTPPGYPPQPQAVPDSDQMAAVRTAFSKFGGDPNALAKGYAHAQGAMTQAEQRASAQGGEIARLQESVAQLTATVHGAINSLQVPAQPAAYPVMNAPRETDNPGAPVMPVSQEEYDENPLGAIAKTVNTSIQQNLAAYEEARRRSDDQTVAKNRYDAKKAEFDAWRPHMTQIYNERPGVYDKLDPYDSMEILLERAKERADFVRAQTFQAEMSQIMGGEAPPQGGIPDPSQAYQPPPGQFVPAPAPYQGIPAPVQPGPGQLAPPPNPAMYPGQTAPPPVAAYPGQAPPNPYPYAGQPNMPGQPGVNIPAGQVGGVRSAPPGTPPGGSWSTTPGMRRLWNASSDSVEEMGAVTQALEERGFGNHLPG